MSDIVVLVHPLGINQSSLFVQPFTLTGGYKYLTAVTAWTPGSLTTTQFITFLANLPPYNGSCEVIPTKGKEQYQFDAVCTSDALFSRVHTHTHIYIHIIHYTDVIMGLMVSEITSLTIVYSTVYSGADQRKHQSSASLAFVRGIHRWPVNSPHKWPITRKMFPSDDVIMFSEIYG